MTIRRLRVPAALVALTLMLVAGIQVRADEPANNPFRRTWARTDLPVAEQQVARTWMWGPEALSPLLYEDYAQSPGGHRVVQYFDKSRMEITHPEAPDDGGPWYVTNGLLAWELITGRMQTGDATLVDLAPAAVNVAGDANDDQGPTYASLTGLLAAPASPDPAVITEVLHRDGSVTIDTSKSSHGIRTSEFVGATGHRVAEPFWAFMHAQGSVYEFDSYRHEPLFENPFYATGYPITEPYWTSVAVAGVRQDVLLQCFQRRCLTYTPGNPAGFQTEAGNVGRHYYMWRYAETLPISAPTPDPTRVPACHPSYPDLCLPPPPPAVTCSDLDRINVTVLHDTWIVQPDPHGLDPDGNGIGCEDPDNPPFTEPPDPSRGVEVQAWVSNASPPQYSSVTIYGRYTNQGQGVPGVRMEATWEFPSDEGSRVETCAGSTNHGGLAHCRRSIGAATPGQTVNVTVRFWWDDTLVTTTSFTPQPLPVDGATQVLASLAQAMTREGFVYHATLAQVHEPWINDDNTAVSEAEVWLDLGATRGRSNYQSLAPADEPGLWNWRGSVPPAAAAVYTDTQIYRAYEDQVWVSAPGPCLGLEQATPAIAFICELEPSFAFPRDTNDGSSERHLHLEQNVEFAGRPAVALSDELYSLRHVYLDAVTFLPLGWVVDLQESGRLITTITSDFVPIEEVDAGLFDPASIGYQPGPAPTGRILFRRDLPWGDTSNPEIFVINADGSGERNLSNNLGWDFGAVWSPDGQRVAFSSDGDESGAHDIFVVDADGSNLTNLTNTPTGEGRPVWSPDGGRIAFLSDRNGTYQSELYVMDASGANTVRLSSLDNLRDPEWSPDAQRIAFASDAGIHLVNADGTSEVLIAPLAGAYAPQWTPDGSRIIVGSSQAGNGDIFILNSDGSGLTNLTDHPARDGKPDLSPDGTRILFVSERADPSSSRDAYIMQVDGSSVIPLVRKPSTNACDVGCSWSPDGAYIVFSWYDLFDPNTGWNTSLAIASADGSLVMTLDGVDGTDPIWSP